MTSTEAKKIVKAIVERMYRPSVFLGPSEPEMVDPYGVLKIVQDLAKLPSKTIDRWMVETQEKMD